MQVAEYVGDRRQRIVKYIGSAHTPAEFGVVMARARDFLAVYEHPGQDGLDLGLGVEPGVGLVEDVPEQGVLDVRSRRPTAPAAPVLVESGRVVATVSGLLFDVLAGG